MKSRALLKLFIFSVIWAGFFTVLAACETDVYSVTVINESLKKVSYVYDDSQDVLEPSASKVYTVKAYTGQPGNISVDGPMSVKLNNYSGEKYIFTDVQPVDLSIINKLPVSIVLKAENYIDDGSENTELTIGPSQEITTAKIYTRNPRFEIISEYSASIDWNIKEEEEKEVMYVTIQ